MGGTLFLGDFHPDLETAFVRRLRELCPDGDARRLLVVVPNRLLATHLRRRAAELGTPTLGLRPRTLEDLLHELAAARLERDGVRELPEWAGALALQSALRGVGRSAFSGLAGRPGLYRTLAATLRDLRDAGVEPEALVDAVRQAGAPTKLRDLARFHRDFDEFLARHKLADAARLTDLALDRLGDADRAAVGEHVLVYGFYDLVGRQRRLLRGLLAGRPADVFFPWVEGRAGEYGQPLRDWFVGLGCAPRPAAETPAPGDDRERLRAFLFQPDTPPPRLRPDGSVRFVSASDPTREALELLRGLVSDPPASALVVLRHEDASAALLHGVAGRAGVPLHVAGPPLASTPAGRAARLLLGLGARLAGGEAEERQVPRREVEALLATGALVRRASAGGRSERWTQLLRQRGIVGRVAEWRALIERYGRPQETLPFPGEAREADEDDRFLDPKLRRELAPLAAWMARLLADLGVLAASLRRGWPAVDEASRTLLEQWLEPGEESDAVRAAVGGLAALDGVLPARAGLLRDAATAVLSTPQGGAWARFGDAPSVVAIAAARGVTAERVLVPQLLDGRFPRRAREDPVLLDDERRRLNLCLPEECRLPLKAESSASEERLLFRLAVGAARSELVLSWPRRAAGGRNAVPSFYVLEAARVLLGRHLDVRRLYAAAESLALRYVALAPPYPATDAEGPPLLGVEYDLRTIDAARHAPPAEIGDRLSYLLAAYPRFDEAVRGERRRFGFATRGILTEYDALVGERLGGALREAMTRPGRGLEISPSALGSYARCSFQFFLARGLGARREEAPEAALDPSAAEMGTLYHELLRDLFARLGAERLLPLRGGAGLERAKRLAGELVAASPALRDLVPAPLHAARSERVRADLERLLATAAEEPWVPRELEWEVGGPGSPPVDVGGRSLVFRGRIDRLDAGPDGLRIVDYKTGKLPAAAPPSLDGGRQLQLYIYQLAIAAARRAHGEVPLPIHGVLLGVTAASGHGRVNWSAADFAAAAREFEEVLDGIVGGIEHGEFFQVENDQYCDQACPFETVCGPSRRALVAGKTADPAVAAALAWRFPPAEKPA